MKSVKRPIDTSFWEDDKVLDLLTPEDKYFFLYLLTNPHTSQVGIYHLPYKIAAFELGYSLEATKSLIERFETRYRMIAYSKEHQEVAIMNALKHNIIKGGKPVIDCIKSELNKVKDIQLVSKVNKHLQEFWNGSDRKTDKVIQQIFEEFLQARKEAKEVINENDNENDNENERIVNDTLHDTSTPRKKSNESSDEGSKGNDSMASQCREVIAYLNEKTGKHFKLNTKGNRDIIYPRLKDGYTVDDMKKIIDNKVADWKGVTFKDGRKGDNYLRPATLFQPSKIEGYLNEAPATSNRYEQEGYYDDYKDFVRDDGKGDNLLDGVSDDELPF